MTQTTSRPAVGGPDGTPAHHDARFDAEAAALVPLWTADLAFPADVDEVLAALVRRRAPTWVMQRLSRLPARATVESPEQLLGALHEGP